MTRISPSLDMSSRPTVKARGAGRQQVDHARPAGRIAGGADDAGGFVDGEVDGLASCSDFAVDADFLRLRIDAGAELGDHLAVDLDAAFEDELLALAAAGDAGGGEHFLQPLAARSVRHRIGPASRAASPAAERNRRLATDFARAFGHGINHRRPTHPAARRPETIRGLR